MQQQSSSEKIDLHDTAGFCAPGKQQLGTTARTSTYTNALLRQIYPKGDDIAATDIVAFFKAGQVKHGQYISHTSLRSASSEDCLNSAFRDLPCQAPARAAAQRVVSL